MRAIFLYFCLRKLRAHRLRALLGLAAVALGVALFVASSLTISSVRESARETMRSLSGAAEWQVTRGISRGVQESALEPIRRIPGAVAAPVIQASVQVLEPQAGSLIVLGVDFATDSMLRLYKLQSALDSSAAFTTLLTPGGVLLTDTFARRNGLQIGSRLLVSTRHGLRPLRVTGLLAEEGPARAVGGAIGVMELHAAQQLFGQTGRVDRIEVAHATRAAVRRAAPGYEVDSAIRPNSMMEDALARIESLGAITVVALLVGLFIIYNSAQISVVERLKEIGTLRALGATRRQVLGALLAEWLGVGLAGSALGIGLGYTLARGLLASTARALNAIVMLIDLRTVRLNAFTLTAALGLGVGTALIATFLPAWSASGISPLEVLRPHRMRLTHSFRTAFAVGLGSLAAGAATVGAIRYAPPIGLAATGLIFVGVALILPQMIILVGRAARGPMLRLFRLEGYLAADNIVKFPQRTALTAVTLGGALTLMVATAALVEGFRAATLTWIEQALPFDFALMPSNGTMALYTEQTAPRALVEKMRHVPGVGIAYGVRVLFAGYRSSDVMLLGIDTIPFREMHRKRGFSPWANRLKNEDAVRSLLQGDGIFVSDNFAAIFGKRAGENLTLNTPRGPRTFRILGTLEDYSWPHGLVAIDLNVLSSLWGDDSVTYVDIYVNPGYSRETVRTEITRRLAGQFALFVTDKQQIARLSQNILEQTVAVANVQVLIALSIGFLGIINSLLISVLQRTREIGLLRAVGMTRGQLARSIVLEGVLIALVGGIIGLIGGLIAGWIPLRLFTFAITGYLYPMVVPWKHLALALATAAGMGCTVSLLPARRAARLGVLEAIGYE